MNAQSLAEELVREHACHTVILYGSRAEGNATPESDWDLLGIRDGGLRGSKRAWQHLAAHDPRGLATFRAALRPGASLAALEALASLVLEDQEDEGRHTLVELP